MPERDREVGNSERMGEPELHGNRRTMNRSFAREELLQRSPLRRRCQRERTVEHSGMSLAGRSFYSGSRMPGMVSVGSIRRYTAMLVFVAAEVSSGGSIVK